MDLMERDYVYPAFGDRLSHGEWAEKGATSSLDRATAHVDRVLATHYPRHIPAEIDEKIRARFPVRLARERMQPNPRWPRTWES
jgi:trimethylamine--corrinoid protein Co-methyltransferase